MGRFLVSGVCPLPFENTRQSFGPGIRSWQFATALAGAGHRVHLVAMVIPEAYGPGEVVATETRDGIEVERLDDLAFFAPAEVRRRLARERPDAVVGATIYGSFALAQAEPEVPFWADQFGHVMAEAQAKAALEGENWPLAYFWRMVREVTRRADRISTVSLRQRHAAIGELGALGRLSAETCGYELVATIPCPVLSAEERASGARVLRGGPVPEDAFLVLWSGGFNVWSDVDTVAGGLERAMAGSDRLHFASTGGAIEGHDPKSYHRFGERVAASPFASRFHLQGWVRAEEVPRHVAEADLGVLAERPIYEGLLGGKNRVVQWMGAGLPVAYNQMGDLGDLLAGEGLGLTFPPGDAEALGAQILWAADHPDELGRMAGRARQVALERFSVEATTRELIAWAAAPERAPDAAQRARIESPADFGRLHQSLSQRARRLPWLGRSRLARAVWRRLVPRTGS